MSNSNTSENPNAESNKVRLSDEVENTNLLKDLEDTLANLHLLVEDVNSVSLPAENGSTGLEFRGSYEANRHIEISNALTVQCNHNEDQKTINANEIREEIKDLLENVLILPNFKENTENNELKSQRSSSEINLGNYRQVVDKETPAKTEEPYLEPVGNVTVELKNDDHQNYTYLNTTLSTLEREILLRGETLENRKAKTLQFPPDVISSAPSQGEKEIVGDDIDNTKVHIFCECEQPGVAGAAVPTVTSFTMPEVSSSRNDNNKLKSESKILSSKKQFWTENVPSKPRPSLIPKLSSSFRNEKSISRMEKNDQEFHRANTETKQSRNISFKRVSLSEKISTSSLVVKECGSNRNISKNELEGNETRSFQDEKQRRYKKLISQISKYVARLAQEASDLSEINNPETQTIAIDSLYNRITNLKKIANDLKTYQSKEGSQTVVLGQSQSADENQTNSRPRSKDNNRIYIKFLPSKSAVRKRKSCNSEVQTDFVSNETSDTEFLETSPNDKTCPKQVDSMDGMFIPSFDEPPKIDEDDDEDGMDITITIPEIQNTVQKDNSHLSVCFSTISAEALGRLKRCPKEFTLRMDFVQGKMFFQSGKSPANNFAIGPDLKITECVIDNKRSDVINIKPSTECLYTSQIIPVEGETVRKNSIKILKSTDSELFNVVSLPFINKRISVATKSCTTFKNFRRVSSESLIPDRTYYKSMPQIPSMSNILEEPALDTVVGGLRSAMINAEKKPRNRTSQKKRTNASLDSILYDAS